MAIGMFILNRDVRMPGWRDFFHFECGFLSFMLVLFILELLVAERSNVFLAIGARDHVSRTVVIDWLLALLSSNGNSDKICKMWSRVLLKFSLYYFESVLPPEKYCCFQHTDESSHDHVYRFYSSPTTRNSKDVDFSPLMPILSSILYKDSTWVGRKITLAHTHRFFAPPINCAEQLWERRNFVAECDCSTFLRIPLFLCNWVTFPYMDEILGLYCTCLLSVFSWHVIFIYIYVCMEATPGCGLPTSLIFTSTSSLRMVGSIASCILITVLVRCLLFILTVKLTVVVRHGKGTLIEERERRITDDEGGGE